MTQVRTGILLPGFHEVGIGASSPVRGISLFNEGEETVIAKLIPDREIAVELICAVIGRELGLPIPEPVLLMDSNKKWYFGSIDAKHPNLAQIVMTSDSAVIDRLEEWPDLLKAACFDEWIANPDRRDENLLFDGRGFLLIDHGLAIPSGMKANDWSDDFYNNFLLDIVDDSCAKAEKERDNLACSARTWSDYLAQFRGAYEESSLPDAVSDVYRHNFSTFLSKRVCDLGSELYRKLNPSQGALTLDV